ncbi:MAG TPA: cytochrome c peroxidase, partial [Candidatus Eisenbacteria bacterium]
ATLDDHLAAVLRRQGFTGMMEASLESRLGRRLDPRLADLGRLLWFDTITGLNDDNTCGGCHSPTAGFGDTQSIAIGIDNNGFVGPHRLGPRNQRRSPIVINAVFYPNLMWNSRFASLSGDPFDNRQGFSFPNPEGLSLSYLPQLLVAQAFIPPTERNEVAGFTFPGDNFAIRAEVLRRLNATPAYRRLFGEVFAEVRAGAPITFDLFGKAIAEFEFTLAFTDAPIDRFARGDRTSMSAEQKRGALLFFGEAGCVSCHAVSGTSHEMFSDFQQHVIGIPQIVPAVTNAVFDGKDSNEDFGLEQITGDKKDRYRFRTSPLRNVAVQPTFFHNGAFTDLERAVRHHLDVFSSARSFTTDELDEDLRGPLGPLEPVLKRVDPLLAEPIPLMSEQVAELVAFVRESLLDPRARPENLMKLIPDRVPSGRTVPTFEVPEAAEALAGGPSGTALRKGFGDARGRVAGESNQGLLELSAGEHHRQARQVTWQLELSRPSRVEASVFDVTGRRVRRLAADLSLGSGSHRLVWDTREDAGREAPGGVYFLSVRAGNASAARRVVVAR